MALFSVICLLCKLQADTYPKSHGMSNSKFGNIPSPERFKVICHANFSTPAMWKKNRRYNMAAQRKKISLWVLKYFTNECSVIWGEKFCIFKWPCSVIYYINSKEIPNYFTFTAKGKIYYVTMVAVAFFSCVKMSSFCPVQLIFHWYLYIML